MDQLAVMEMDLPGEVEKEPYQLQELNVRHREAASLLAQGLDRATIAQVTGYKPEYITWLSRQPIFRAYIAQMSQYVDVRLEALFDQSVDVIADGLRNGSVEDKLKAARLQLEATARIGKNAGGAHQPAQPDRLEQLAQRLVGLMQQKRGATYDGTVTEVEVPAGMSEQQDTHQVQGAQPGA